MALIELNKVGYQVDNTQILTDIDLSIEPEEFVTIAGPSGSGKSTLTRIIASLISKTSGELTFDGQSIESYDPIDYRRLVSYCFQQPTLFGETVRDNLSFPYQVRQLPLDEDRANEALDTVQLSGTLDKKIISLSGGERQRIALLRNVMFYPKVLILDEVTAGLDAENKQVVQQMLTHFNVDDHITMLMISHDADEIKAAQRLITIEAGRLTKDEVATK